MNNLKARKAYFLKKKKKKKENIKVLSSAEYAQNADCHLSSAAG